MSEPSVRSMEAMLAQLHCRSEALDGPERTDDGWCRSLSAGLGFRYEYDDDVARGGWEFYRLGNGICVATVDMVPAQALPRRYSSADYLALAAVLEGNLLLNGNLGGELADGFGTVYGMQAEGLLETMYPAGEHLRWVTVYLERASLFHVTGLSPRDLPDAVIDYVLYGGNLPCRKVPLSRNALLVASQLLQPPFDGSFRHAFLTAKAIELSCYILFDLAHDVERMEVGSFSGNDHKRLQNAMRLIRSRLDEPLNVQAIADSVGLTRERLQRGFRMVYGDTVAKVRDRVRMELALELIRDSQMTMIEIALETGYEHPASFTRAFRAAYGVSPIEMRQAAHDELRLKHLGRPR